MRAPPTITNIITIENVNDIRVYYPDVNFVKDSDSVFTAIKEENYEMINVPHFGLTTIGNIYYMNERGSPEVLVRNVQNVLKLTKDKFVIIFKDGRLGYVENNQFERARILDFKLDSQDFRFGVDSSPPKWLFLLINPASRFIRTPIEIEESMSSLYPNKGVPTPFPTPPLESREILSTFTGADLRNIILGLPKGMVLSDIPYPGVRAIESTSDFRGGKLPVFSIPINPRSTWVDIIKRVDEALDKYPDAFNDNCEKYPAVFKGAKPTENSLILQPQLGS